MRYFFVTIDCRHEYNGTPSFKAGRCRQILLLGTSHKIVGKGCLLRRDVSNDRAIEQTD